METATPRSWPATLALGLALTLTRSHHFADALHLPDASWAIFFLAGWLLRTQVHFLVLFLLAATVDLAAITWGGVSGFCVTPAYAFLLPAYGALFHAGRWYGRGGRGALSLATAVAAGALACEVVASGGFYFFSGRFAEPDAAGLLARLIQYFPLSLQALVFHLALFLLARGIWLAAAGSVRLGRQP